MAINSRDKGARGERSVAHLFQKAGYPAERGCQHDGRTGHADVVGIPHIWVEVKRDQDLNVLKAIEQAERDSSALTEDVLPVAIHRKNREQWKCTMRVLDFLTLCGVTPFSFSCPVDGLVTMVWDEWIKIYTAYEAERGM